MKTPKKQPEPYDDDDCEVCRLMRRGDVAQEVTALVSLGYGAILRLLAVNIK